MSFSGTQDKCKACDKTVHFCDLLSADGVTYHKTCFKCSHCKGNLTMCSYSSMDGVLYCKPHFEQLFKETGSFSKKFQTNPKADNKEQGRAPSRSRPCSAGLRTNVPSAKRLSTLGEDLCGRGELPQDMFQVLPWGLHPHAVELRCAERDPILQAPLCAVVQREGKLQPPHQGSFHEEAFGRSCLAARDATDGPGGGRGARERERGGRARN